MYSNLLLSLSRFSLRNYVLERLIKIVSDPTNKSSIPKPTDPSPVAVQTNHPSDPTVDVVMINCWPNAVTPSPETNRATPFIKLVVLFFRESIDPFDPTPPGLLLLALLLIHFVRVVGVLLKFCRRLSNGVRFGLEKVGHTVCRSY